MSNKISSKTLKFAYGISSSLVKVLSMSRQTNDKSWFIIAALALGFLTIIYLRRDTGIEDVTVHTIGDDCELLCVVK